MNYLRQFLRLIIIAVFSACLTGPVASAQIAESLRELDAYIETGMVATDMPGLAIVVIEGGEPVFTKGYGRANNLDAPVTENTSFQLGSVSKSLTALAVLILVDEGAIDLDAPVISYLPEFKTADPKASARITVRQILSHHSGMTMLEGNQYQGTRYRGADALDNAVARLQSARLWAAPGERFQYSNANYAVAGAILERVEGKPFEDILRERIFIPLGMTASYVQTPPDGLTDIATGYRDWFGITRAYDFIPGRMMAPAGGVISSAKDMGIYIRAMTDPNNDLISQRARAALFDWRPAWDDNKYGLGWGMTQTQSGLFISHEGLNGGFKTASGFYPETGRGVAVMTNQSSPLTDGFALAVMDKAMGLPPRSYTPGAGPIVTLIGLGVLNFALLAGVIMSVMKIRAGLPAKSHPALRLAFIGGLLGAAYLLVKVIPAMNNMTLASIYPFYPDLALLLGLGAGLAIIWAVAVAASLIRRRSHSREA